MVNLYYEVKYPFVKKGSWKCGEVIGMMGDDNSGVGDRTLGARIQFVVSMNNLPPTADIGGPYTVDEGGSVEIDGTGSSDPDGSPLTYRWQINDSTVDTDGELIKRTYFKDSPTFTYDWTGDDKEIPLKLTVTDEEGASDVAETTITVNNVEPTIADITATPNTQDENSPIEFAARVTDPGSDDVFVSWDWEDASGDSEEYYLVDGTPDGLPSSTNDPRDETDNQTHTWGDNGEYDVEFCVWDDDMQRDASFSDDDKVCQTVTVTIDNVNPTAVIDETNTLDVEGTLTFSGQINTQMDFTGNSQDLGSEDITFTWDWGDGSFDSQTHYLVDSDNPDGLPSPSIDPRDLTDHKSHVWINACLYNVNLNTQDDDGGFANDSTSVVIVGDADSMRGAGEWQTDVSKIITEKGKAKQDATSYECLLSIASHMSAIYDEKLALSTIPDSFEHLKMEDGDGLAAEFDREILTAWLNFANGAIKLDDQIDTDGDGIEDKTFSEVMELAESISNDPGSSIESIEEQKDLLQEINEPSKKGGPKK